MVVNEEDVVNIMAGMQHAGGIKLNDHKRKLKNRSEEQGYRGVHWNLKFQFYCTSKYCMYGKIYAILVK